MKNELPVLRPSGSSRWLKCPGSLVLSEQAEPQKSLDKWRAAAQGTAAHKLVEDCLSKFGYSSDPDEHIGEKIVVPAEESESHFDFTFTVDQEMADGARMFIDYVRGLKPVEFLTEHHMKHSDCGLEGTADFLGLMPSKKHIDVVDFKYGTAGVNTCNRKNEVNTQLLSYAALALDEFKAVESFGLHIVQPRRSSAVKTRVTYVDSPAVRDHIERCKEAENNLDHFEAGSHCYWCPARMICQERKLAEARKHFGNN